jgi:hypothetical protein
MMEYVNETIRPQPGFTRQITDVGRYIQLQYVQRSVFRDVPRSCCSGIEGTGRAVPLYTVLACQAIGQLSIRRRAHGSQPPLFPVACRRAPCGSGAATRSRFEAIVKGPTTRPMKLPRARCCRFGQERVCASTVASPRFEKAARLNDIAVATGARAVRRCPPQPHSTDSPETSFPKPPILRTLNRAEMDRRLRLTLSSS